MNASHYDIRDFEPGALLFRAGETLPDPAKACAYLVLAGRLEAFLDGPKGKPVSLGYIEPGQIVGEMALLDGQPRSAHVRACPEIAARCAVITLPVMQRLINEADPVLRALLNAYAKRLRAANVHAAGADAPMRRSGNVLLSVTDNAKTANLIAMVARNLEIDLVAEASGLKALNAITEGLRPAIIVAGATSLDLAGGMLAKMLGIKGPKPRPAFVLLDREDGKAVSFNPRDVDDIVDLPIDAYGLTKVVGSRLKAPRRAA